MQSQSTTTLRSFETPRGTPMPSHVKVPGTSQISGPTQSTPDFDPTPGQTLAQKFAEKRR